jgi:hypothetical protein
MSVLASLDRGRPSVGLLGDWHRTMRRGDVLICFDKKQDALRRSDGVSLTKAHELVKSGKTEWIVPPEGVA